VATNDGVRLSVIDVGRGPPVVILPAWSNAAVEYWPQIIDFAVDHRVIAVDMRGHGESEKVEHGYRVCRLAADLQDVLTNLDLQTAALMGHSMGCSVIWAYLDLFGAYRASRLILVDQAATQLIQPWWTAEDRQAFGCRDTPEDLFTFCADLVGADGEQVTRDLFLGLFTLSFDFADAEAIVDEILKMPRRHAAALMLDHATRDWRDAIRRIALPSLVVGAHKSVSPPESQAWIADQIPGARLAIFEEDEGGSHFMCFENPEKFNALVREFLDAA
jgi:pimeloyl-ACP methyl ester carboxylesterase